MAMTMSGEYQLAATPEAVWAKLNDPAVLKACIPGCDSSDKCVGENEFLAVATNKIGPVKATLQGQGEADRSRSAERLQDLRPGRGRRGRLRQGRRLGQADPRRTAAPC